MRLHVTEHGAARLSIRLDVPSSMGVLDTTETPPPQPGYRSIDLLMAEEFKQFAFSSVGILANIMSLMQKPSFTALCNLLRHPLQLMRSINQYNRAQTAVDAKHGRWARGSGPIGTQFPTPPPKGPCHGDPSPLPWRTPRSHGPAPDRPLRSTHIACAPHDRPPRQGVLCGLAL